MQYRRKRGKTPVNPPVLDVENVASATECTGLTPAAVQTPEQASNYAQLYAVTRQKTAWKDEEKS